jgi:hypothetical protein
MRSLSVVAIALLLAATPALAQDTYAILEDQPAVGSTIKRRLVSWPVPINRTYAELSPEHRAIVRAPYKDMAAGDEPPYPVRGMEPLLREVSVVQKNQLGEGPVKIVIKVDEKGEAQSAARLESPSNTVTQLVAFALMREKYKPGTCGGRPCARDFVFEHNFQRDMRGAPSESFRPYESAR